MRPLWLPSRRVAFFFLLPAFAMLVAGRPSFANPSPPAAATAARAEATPRAPRPATDGLLAADDEEKERISKPKKEEPRHKPEQEKPRSEHRGHQDEDDSSDCFGSCLGSFFGSLFSSTTPPPPPAPVSALREEAMTWVVGERAWLRATAPFESVALWEQPEADKEEGTEAGRLPHGAAVVVAETYATAGGMWLRVRPMDGVEPVGWIPAGSASTAPPPPPMRPKPPRRPPTWGVQVALGGGGGGPSELNVEYREGTFRVEAQYLRFLPKQWQSGAGVGFRQSAGNPQVLYLTPTTIDEPSDSRLWMLDIGARGGQRYGDRSGFRFGWLLGPALYYVHENANVKTFDRSTMALIGTGVERLGRWAGGGDVRFGFGWMAGEEGVEVSLVADAYMMGWKGHKNRSLSSDFVRVPIHGFDVAVAVTFPAP